MSLDIVSMVECADFYATFEVVGSKGETYRVSFHGGEGGADCTCPSFRFGQRGRPVYDRTCKHIEQVFKDACFYHQNWHDGGPCKIRPVEVHNPNPVEGEVCPNCGGPVVGIRVAV